MVHILLNGTEQRHNLLSSIVTIQLFVASLSVYSLLERYIYYRCPLLLFSEF